MKEYIIHGTTIENLENILKYGYIEAHIDKKKEGVLIESQKVNQIFTQLLYRNLPHENIQIPHWLSCCIVLDKKILKDYPFYGTQIGGFYTNFSDAFAKDAENIYVKSKGHLKKMPNLKKLKTYIEKNMEYKQTIGFIHSHEILFDKRILLKKYCKMILCRADTKEVEDTFSKNIMIYAEKLKIPIKYYANQYDFIGYGLNNFIDLIEI